MKLTRTRASILAIIGLTIASTASAAVIGTFNIDSEGWSALGDSATGLLDNVSIVPEPAAATMLGLGLLILLCLVGGRARRS